MYDFVNNWSNNPIVVKKIKEYLPSYFLQFKPEDQPIIYKLLENAEYYNEEKLERILQRYFANVEFIYENVKGRCKVSTIFQDDLINHNTSKIMSWCPKSINVISNILRYNLNEIDDLIIIDDYCGSGNTILSLLTKIDKTINNKINIYYCPVFITSEAIRILNDKKFNNTTFILVPYLENAALCLSVNNIFSDEEKEKFINICKEKNIDYIYGFNNSEDKFASKIFTPNNSLGVLWYSERLYKPLFRRNGHNLIKNYKYLSNNQIEEFKKIIIHTSDYEKITKAKFALLMYNNYNIEEIEEFLGINNGRYILKSLLAEKILKLQNNRYCFYQNLEKYFRKDKLNLYVEFGEVITKQDEIENKLRSLIV